MTSLRASMALLVYLLTTAFVLSLWNVTASATANAEAINEKPTENSPAKDTLQQSQKQSLKQYRTAKVTVQGERRRDRRALRSVEGSGIYEAKKTESIAPDELIVNRATNNARQIFSKVAGVHVWESDGAGLQLGIGARGLSPNRTSHFNTRQNGCDMSADALGYPESYYTPPAEAIDRIDIVRGAASLQYGTQFGGMVNFIMKRGSEEKAIEAQTRQTLGAWGLWNSFVSLGGTLEEILGKDAKINYYGFFQHKQGQGQRPNSGFNLSMGYASARAYFSPTLSLQADYTIMEYVAQQPGGLTDRMFEEDPFQSVRHRNWFRVQWQMLAVNLDIALSPSAALNSRFFGVFSGRDALGNLERINVVDFGRERTLLSDSYNNVGNETRLIYRYPSVFNQMFGANEISTFVAGFRLYKGQTNRRQGNASDGKDADFRYLRPENLENSVYTFPGYNMSLFAEHIFWLASNLSITPGVRYEHIATFADGYWRQKVVDFAGNILADNINPERLERLRSFPLFGVGISYRFNGDNAISPETPASPKSNQGEYSLELYANISQNYRSITFSDLRVVNPNFKVDSALRDERGFNADIGLRGQITPWLAADVSVFYLEYADKIGNILRSDEPPLFLPYRFRTNIGTARTIGLESLLELDLSRLLFSPQTAQFYRLTAFVNSSLLDARYIETQDASARNKFVELAPPFMLRSGATLKWNDAIGFNIQYSHTAEHFTDATNAIRTATAVNGVIPAYSVWDIGAQYSFVVFEKLLRIEAGVNNLFDARYFTRRADGYPGPGVIPSEGRSWYVTIEATI